jgi:aryl-alcohol dehydrogenase-like predicted oxidoreductase
MIRKTVGQEKASVPAIGIGSMGVGGYFAADRSADEQAIETLRYAFDLGMTLVDTAEGYASGHSEELVGKAIASHDREVFVATKVSPEHLSRAAILQSAESSRERLGVGQIDLLQVHWPNPRIPLEETMAALDFLVQSGTVRAIGLSNFSLRELKDAQRYLGTRKIAAVQVEYNLFDRTIEREYLPWCIEQGISVIAYSPLDQGQICGGPKKRALLEPVAERIGCSLGQLALSWIVGHPGVLAIPKAARREHVALNAAAGEIALSPRDAAEVDSATSASLVEVPVNRIRAVPDDTGQRTVYRTVEEALANASGFVPSPSELAAQMRSGELLKAVRVRPAASGTPGYDYDLVEGRIRYWAWVIAFDGQRDIPVLVRE